MTANAKALLTAAMILVSAPAGAAVIAQGHEDVTTPGVVSVIPTAGLAGAKHLYLTIDSGTLADASWEVDTSYQSQWWDETFDPANPLYLNGEEFNGGIDPENNTDQHLTFGSAIDQEVISTLAPSLATISVIDFSAPFNSCGSPAAFPVGVDCSESGGVVALSLFAFDVNASRSFNWVLSDSLTASAPEPASWALLLLGAAMAGTMLRRHANQFGSVAPIR